MVLPTSACWSLLRSAEVGRLGILVDGRPDVLPVNHVVDHGTLVFRTAPGTKLAAASGHAVAFEVDGYDSGTGQAWSVVVHGRAEEVRRLHDLVDTAGLPLFPWHTAPKHTFVRIVPDEVSGRRFTVADRDAWASGVDSGPRSGGE